MSKRTATHLLLWLFYLAFETTVEFAWVSASFADKSVFFRFNLAIQAEVALLLIKLPYVYALLWITRNSPESGRDRIRHFLGTLVLSVGTLIVYRLIVGFVLVPNLYQEQVDLVTMFQLSRMISSILDLLTLAGVAVGLAQYQLRSQERERRKQLENEKLRAELHYLRSQIQPHFLFNTLNNIYGLARKRSDQAAESILRLSGLLRFMLYENAKERVPLSSELQLLNDYIELERLRYGNRLQFSFKKEIEDENVLLAPLLLLPLVENAFKHGAGESVENPLVSITLTVTIKTLEFTVVNSVEPRDGTVESGRLGLANLRRQLELQYPGHRFEVTPGPEHFTAHLTLPLDHYAGTFVSDH